MDAIVSGCLTLPLLPLHWNQQKGRLPIIFTNGQEKKENGAPEAAKWAWCLRHRVNGEQSLTKANAFQSNYILSKA